MRGPRQKTPLSSTNPISTDPPDWISDYAKEVWTVTLEEVTAAGRTIDALDLQLFTCFCVSAGHVRQCNDILAKDGLVVDGGREGSKRHPAIQIQSMSLAHVRTYAVELGLSTSSRGRLPVPVEAKISKFSDLKSVL